MVNERLHPEDDDWHPEPQTAGRLGPPGRKPPTAIATATPRPPRQPYRPGRYRGLGATQRIARGMLSTLLVTSGSIVPLIQTSLIGLTLGLTLGGLGILVAARLIRQREGRRIVSLRRKPSEPDVRSA